MSDGQLGEAPDWWNAFEAAAECNSQPWVVAALPETAGHHWWVEWALIHKAAIVNARIEIQRLEEIRRSLR